MVNLKRDKNKINLLIDTIMLIVFMSIAGLGFLVKYVLLPGYKVNEKYGTNTELLFGGLDRHQWGTIHLYLAFFLIFLLLLHIIFHWSMIVSIFRQMIPGKTVRYLIALFIGILSIFLAIAPLFVKPQILQLQRKHSRNHEFEIPSPENPVSEKQKLQDQAVFQAPEFADKNKNVDTHHDQYNQIDINGTMTLDEISGKYNISVQDLAKVLNIPVKYANERLGRLKKRYGFEIDDLRVYVINNSQNNDR